MKFLDGHNLKIFMTLGEVYLTLIVYLAIGRFSLIGRRVFDMYLHIKGLDFDRVIKDCEGFHLN